jgi:hypothetical protein
MLTPDRRRGVVRPVKIDDEATSTARMIVVDSPAICIGATAWVEHPHPGRWVDGRIARVFASEVEVFTR